MRYIAYLVAEALGCVHGVVAGYGTVDSILDTPDTADRLRTRSDLDARRLLAAIAAPNRDCLVIDLSLITPAVTQSIVDTLREFPRPVVAYSSITTAALNNAVILAQRTQTRFVFRGTTTEQSTLQQVLLLTPDVELRVAFLSRIEPQMSRLPRDLVYRLREMFLTGEGARSLNALAMTVAVTNALTTHSTLVRRALTRRTLDRHLARAGFVSGKRLLEAARVISGYSTVAESRAPFKSVARMLGYTVRTMDAQFTSLLGVSCKELRRMPLSPDEVVERLARRLTER